MITFDFSQKTNACIKFIKHNKVFIALWILYASLGLINLTRLPIAWTDEIQHLDPVFNFFKFGKYASNIWPNPNANNHFLSYPPLVGDLLLFWLSIFPKTIFFSRLPFLLIHLSTVLLLYKYLKNKLSNSPLIAILLTVLFIFDKSVFEISRSGRVETIINFLLILYFTQIQKTNRLSLFIIGITLACLSLAHLYIIPLVLIAIDRIITLKQYNNTAIITGFTIPILLTFLFLQPNLLDFKSQLLFQTSKHQADGFNSIVSFFWFKFWPYYREQPFAPFLYLTAIIFAIKQMIQTPNSEKSSIPATYFLILIISQATLLAPHMRYHSVHVLFIVLILGDALQKPKSHPWNSKNREVKIVSIILFSIIYTAGYFARNIISMVQYHERNPQIIANLIHKHEPKNNFVIFGEPVADYCLVNNKNAQFGLEFYPEHWQYNPDKTYFLLHRTPPEKLPFLIPIDSTLKPNPLPKLLKSLGKAHTYAGLYYYRIPNKQAWDTFFSPKNLQQITGK